MKEFKDKVAVITGAANGIGYSLAKKAISEGMKIVISDIEKAALTQAEAELKANGGEVLAVVTDVTKIDEMHSLAQKTIDEYGAVHLLCNNAGVGFYMKSTTYAWESPLEDWKWILDVNLMGVLHGIQVFVPIMLKQDFESHVLNTASMAGLVPPIFGSGIYSVSKHALIALSESLKNDLIRIGANVKVSVLCPTFVNTKLGMSDRNRPKELTIEYEPNPDFDTTVKGAQGALEKGMSPDKVSDFTFQALKKEFFYILSDTGLSWKKMVSNRMDGILEAFKENKDLKKLEAS